MAKKKLVRSSERFSQSEILNDVLEYVFSTALFPYQREFVRDESRFKIGNKARQIGLSTCLGLEGLLDVIKGESVYYVSRTEKQSVYLLDKFFKWADFFRNCGVELNFDNKTKTECRINGADVKSLTSSAVAGEGFSGNVYLDEFALHDNDKEIYRSLYPTITWGYKIRIISRPFGQSNLFYDIFTDVNKYPDYSRHEYNIYRAVNDGLMIDVEQLKRNFDEDFFAENFECKFIDESTSFFPYELIRPCINEDVVNFESNSPVYCGIDVGRKNDATVVTLLIRIDNIFYVKKMEELKNYTFDAQIESIARIFKEHNVSDCLIDSTGVGLPLAESLRKRFPFVQMYNFSIPSKEQLVLQMKRKFENKEIRLPDDENLIYDIHSIYRKITATNQVSYTSKRNSQGHGDRFWSLALAVKSADGSNVPKIILLGDYDEEEMYGSIVLN